MNSIENSPNINHQENTVNASPLFSIIIPTYNRAHLVKRAINSVINQTLTCFELIIIDDGSRDDTQSVINTFNDNRIIYFKQPSNKGVLSALNKGFDFAKGVYICILGDDDELISDALKIIYRTYKELNEKRIILWFDCINAEEKKISGSGINKPSYISFKDLLCGKFQGDHFIVFERDMLGNNRFDDRLWGDECQLWLKLHNNFKAFYIPKILYVAYRNHGYERMCSPLSGLKHIDRLILTDKVFLEYFGDDLKSFCPKKYGLRLLNLGSLLIFNGENANGRKLILIGLKYKFSKKHLLLSLLSYFANKDQMIYLLIKLQNLY